MSKKDRLKAQAQKQDIRRKELEEEERQEREEARYKRSKAAKKLMKKAKRDRYYEPIILTILRILMIIPFGYSGFYYGGILIFGIFGKYIEPAPPVWVGWSVLAGTVLILAGIIVDFLKKHLISFIIIATGTVFYLRGVQYLIDYIRKRLDEVYVEEALRDMDKVYMQRHYPISAVAGISLIILIIAAIRKILAKKRARHLRDTAPVKSILD